MTSTTKIGIAHGGTGQTTKVDAFKALSPTSAKGDLIVRGVTNDENLPIGTANQVLASDGETAYWKTPIENTLTTLTTGVVKNTVTVVNTVPTSTLTTAVNGTDFYGPSTPNAVAIAEGGTGAKTAGNAFTALAPAATLTGTIAYWGGSSWTVLTPGAAGSFLIINDAGALEWADLSANV